MSQPRVQPAERGPQASHPAATLSPVPGRAAASSGPVRALAARAMVHRAVRHPYLERLRSGDLPDPVAALRDFARHYRGYSYHFPRYLTAVMSRLAEPRHREALLANLVEESGRYDGAELRELRAAGIDAVWVDGVPHPELFRRLCVALGVEDGGEEEPEVECWRDLFLGVLTHGSAAEAVGALGLGTEGIVREIYRPLLVAAQRAGVEPRDAAFLTLHTLVDDHHQASLLAIAEDLAGSPEGLRDLERGMNKALHLRAGFWDFLLQRALEA
jgi:pyrroloquinoline quinone (PQQ) biosynthesis protein C